MAQDSGHALLLEIVINFAKITVPIDTLAETKMEMIIVGSKMRAGKIGVDTGRIELLRLQQKIEWEDGLWVVFQTFRLVTGKEGMAPFLPVPLPPDAPKKGAGQ